MRHAVGVGLLAVLAACGTNSEDLKQIKDSQRLILAKLADLDKKVEGIAGKAVAPPPRPTVDPNKVYNIPVGDSPFKGPANAPVVLAEFSDFQ
jgi:protein-disulfide isomerase